MLISWIAMTIKGLLLLAASVYAFAFLLKPEDAKWIKGTPFKIFLGFFLIGMWGHSPWIIYAALFLVVPIFSKDRAEAAAFYVIALLALPMLNMKLFIGSIFFFPITKYLICGLGLLMAFLIKPGSRAKGLRYFDVPMVLILILETAEVRDANIFASLRQMVPVIFSIAIPYFVVSRTLQTPSDIRKFVLAIGFSGFVLAIVATMEQHAHWLLYKQMEGPLGLAPQVNAFQKLRGGALRAPASFVESTSLGNFLAIAGIATLMLQAGFKSRKHWLIAVGVVFFGLIAPNSRGAFIGLAVGLIMYDFYRSRWPSLSIKLGALAVVYLAALATAPFSPYIAELVGQGSDSQGSSDYRVRLFQRGMEEIHKNPVLGTTLKNALGNLQDLTTGEHIIDLVNGYITYGLVLGYPGMVGLLLVFITLALSALIARKKLSANSTMKDVGAFVFSVGIIMAFVTAFTSFGGEGSIYFYEIIALGSALWAARKASWIVEGTSSSHIQLANPSPLRAMIEADRARARMPRMT